MDEGTTATAATLTPTGARMRYHVGLDVHQASIVAAVADSRAGTLSDWGRFATTEAGLRTLIARLQALGPAEVWCCYEAGPTGYSLQRTLGAAGVVCLVVAPSLIPVKPGERVKTDRRDARKLARYLQSGQLTPVWVPDADTEALRDLTRARTTAQQVLQEAKTRLRLLLLRRDQAPPAGVAPWTIAYRAWLRGLRWAHPLQQLAFDEARAAVAESEARVARLEGALKQAQLSAEQQAVVAALQCLHGVAMVTATTLVAEIGAIDRFPHPAELFAYAGLVPREASSGRRVQRGSITKTGNAHLRGIAVEAAWHYRHKPQTGPALKRRRQAQPAAVIGIAQQAQQRLHRRYWHLVDRQQKPAAKAAVAVARELLGVVWAIWQDVRARQAAAPAA
jgi:transposase